MRFLLVLAFLSLIVSGTALAQSDADQQSMLIYADDLLYAVRDGELQEIGPADPNTVTQILGGTKAAYIAFSPTYTEIVVQMIDAASLETQILLGPVPTSGLQPESNLLAMVSPGEDYLLLRAPDYDILGVVVPLDGEGAPIFVRDLETVVRPYQWFFWQPDNTLVVIDFGPPTTSGSGAGTEFFKILAAEHWAFADNNAETLAITDGLDAIDSWDALLRFFDEQGWFAGPSISFDSANRRLLHPAPANQADGSVTHITTNFSETTNHFCSTWEITNSEAGVRYHADEVGSITGLQVQPDGQAAFIEWVYPDCNFGEFRGDLVVLNADNTMQVITSTYGSLEYRNDALYGNVLTNGFFALSPDSRAIAWINKQTQEAFITDLSSNETEQILPNIENISRIFWLGEIE